MVERIKKQLDEMVINAIAMNSHINERKCGVHLGLGQHNQEPSCGLYQCDMHLDLIVDGDLLWIGDDPSPSDLENFVASSAHHPNDVRDEDFRIASTTWGLKIVVGC